MNRNNKIKYRKEFFKILPKVFLLLLLMFLINFILDFVSKFFTSSNYYIKLGSHIFGFLLILFFLYIFFRVSKEVFFFCKYVYNLSK